MGRTYLNWKEDAKRRAAVEAVKHVKDGDFVGLGSGSTAKCAIEELGSIIRDKGLNVLGVPTSYDTMLLAVENGIPLTTLDEHPELDIAIDGADQIAPNLNLIKGGGAALTKEKIVDRAAKQLIIVADETKLAETLGRKCPVPIEVLPFAAPRVLRKIRELNGKPTLRNAVGKVGPIITDNGNFIIDAHFGPIEAPKKLEAKLKSIPGIIETGLFIEMADIAYIGYKTGFKIIKRAK